MAHPSIERARATLQRLADKRERPDADPEPERTALDSWFASAPTNPLDVEAWIKSCPDRTMFEPPPPKPEPPRYASLDEFKALQERVAQLGAQLVAVRSEAGASLDQAYRQIADEVGSITGGLGREIDQLRKRLEDKPKR
jgi:hypothetical protein